MAAADPGPTPAPFPRRWALPLLLVFSVGFLLALRPLADNTIEFHLRGGRWILEHRAFPGADPFTYGAQGRDYVDLHWLFQVAAYALHRLAGFAGLSVLNALLAAALLGLLALRLRRLGAGPAASCWVLLAAAVIMHQRFLMRPENVSYLLLALLLLVLDRYRETADATRAGLQGGPGGAAAARLLWPVPLLHLLWANTQGLFVLGWVVVGAYWLSASLRARRPDRALAAALAASIAACLANPYGLRGLLFPFSLLSRFDRGNVFAQHVGEFQPLWKVGGLFEDFVLYGFALALLAAGALIWRRLRPHEVLLSLAFGALALAGIRNVPLFVIVAAPTLGRALTALAPRAPARAFPRAAGAALFSTIAAGLLLRVLTGAFFQTPGLPQGGVGVGLDTAVRPVAAAEFLRANRLDGRILNSSSIGGWLGWALPQRVFMDMRLEVMGEDLYQQEVDSWGEGGLERLIARYEPQLVVFDLGGGAKGWAGQLRDPERWRPVYVDGAAAVFARRGYAPSLPGIEPHSLPARFGLEPLEEEAVRGILSRPVPGRLRRWLGGFVERSGEGAGTLVSLGRFCELQGAGTAAERFYLEALDTDRDRCFAAYGELAALYGESGHFKEALLCYDQLLRYRPDDPVGHNGRGIARAMLGDPEGAIRDFTRALELDPAFVFALLNRALARSGLGNAAGAREDFARVLRLDPGNAQALEGLAALAEVSP